MNRNAWGGAVVSGQSREETVKRVAAEAQSRFDRNRSNSKEQPAVSLLEEKLFVVARIAKRPFISIDYDGDVAIDCDRIDELTCRSRKDAESLRDEARATDRRDYEVAGRPVLSQKSPKLPHVEMNR